MSSSSSKAKNETTTIDRRETKTINAGIGGDIEEGAGVVSGNYGDTSLTTVQDKSFTEFNDNSDRSTSVDNSFALDLEDNSSTDNSVDESYTDNSQTITDGGAFDVVREVGVNLIDKLGTNQEKTLNAANDLVNRSLDAAFSIKAGQTITEPANQTYRELASAGVKVAVVGGAAYVAVSAFKSRKRSNAA